MTRWGALSLLTHAAIWLALLFWPRLTGPGLIDRPTQPPVKQAATEPALIEVVIGHGGQAETQAEPEPAPEVAPPAPEPAPPAPEPVPPDATAPPLATPPPPPPPLASPGGPVTVRLGDPGQPPYADLLDPEKNRFRAATQDTGNRMPVYPRDAALRLESGTVKLQLFVDPGGKVVNALITRSSGSASLDRAARDQALTWRFSPAKRDGKPVPDIAEIEIEFKLI